MIMLIRRFVLLLLLVLQGFTPLVHAHVQVDGVDAGLHIHGINIGVSAGVEVSALDTFGHCAAVIDVKQAISQKKLLDAELENNHLCLHATDFIQPYTIARYVTFATYTTPIISSIRLSPGIPRGPPL